MIISPCGLVVLLVFGLFAAVGFELLVMVLWFDALGFGVSCLLVL